MQIELMAHAENEILRLDNKRREMDRIKGARNVILSLSFLSYYEATNCFRSGYISEYQYYLYRVYWNWGNHRISSASQDKYYEKHGFDKVTERINKFRTKLGLKTI